MGAVFIVVGLAAVLSAAVAVSNENPIYAALFTLVTLGGVAVEFALLSSPFLASMQILLYAGAIMVLFVFVIMLLSLKKEEHGQEPPLMGKFFAGLVAAGVFGFLYIGISQFQGHSDWSAPEQAATLGNFGQAGLQFGSAEHFGHFLYGSSVVPFELASVLITAAVAGVVLLARKHAPTSAQITLEQQQAARHAALLHGGAASPAAAPVVSDPAHAPVAAGAAQEGHR